MLHPLKKYLQERNILEKDFAHDIHITGQAVSNIIRGLAYPSYATLKKIIKATDEEVTADILLKSFDKIKEEKEALK